MTIGLDEAGLVLEEIVMLLGIVLDGGFEKKRMNYMDKNRQGAGEGLECLTT